MLQNTVTLGSNHICLYSSAFKAFNSDKSHQQHSIWPRSPMDLALKRQEHYHSLPLPDAKSKFFMVWWGGDIWGSRVFKDSTRGFHKTEEAKPVTVLPLLPAETAPWSKVSPEPYLWLVFERSTSLQRKSKTMVTYKYHEQSTNFVSVSIVENTQS